MGKTKGKVLEFIKTYINNHRFAPTIREIRDGVGLKSTSAAHAHIKSLKAAGLIDYSERTSRTITITEGLS